MQLRAVEQVIGLTEIFGQQLQTGEHLLHICGGRADGAAVETLRRVRIERRLLPAGAARRTDRAGDGQTGSGRELEQ